MKGVMKHIKQSLAMKLGLGMLTLAVVIFIVSLGMLFIVSRRMVHTDAVQRATNTLHTASLRITSFLEEIETATDNIEWIVLENLQPDSLLAFTHRIVELHPNVNGCSITMEPDFFPQCGKYFSAYSIREGDHVTTVREGEYDYYNKVWYKTPRTLGKPCWVDPFNDYNPGTLYSPEMIASYCKPLVLPDGRFAGVISTDLSLRHLSKAITAEKPYPNSYFIMLGQKGHYFVHPDANKILQQTIFTDVAPDDHPDIIALGHLMTEGTKGNMRVTVNGRKCLVFYQRQPNTEWSIALICPESDIFRNYRHLAYIVCPLLAIGLLLILLLCQRAVRHAITPLYLLVKQSQRIAAGNFDQQIAHSSRTDEVGRLQNSFAVMQESLARHISHIRQVNAETAQRNKELEEANRLAEQANERKTTFIQNVTHQIRTPLNIILGFSQILRDDVHLLPEEEVDNITGMLDRNTVTLNRMILMLFDSSETGSYKQLTLDSVVSCNEAARECIAYVQRQFPDMPVKFETTLDDDFRIKTNHLYLLRSLREILYNSGKYSDKQHVSLKAEKTATTVRFTFEDTGPGIAEDYRDIMYVPFTKTNDLSEGLGLGLPLTKRHCQNLGGDLTLDTTYHEGCKMIIELPIL